MKKQIASDLIIKLTADFGVNVNPTRSSDLIGTATPRCMPQVSPRFNPLYYKLILLIMDKKRKNAPADNDIPQRPLICDTEKDSIQMRAKRRAYTKIE